MDEELGLRRIENAALQPVQSDCKRAYINFTAIPDSRSGKVLTKFLLLTSRNAE